MGYRELIKKMQHDSGFSDAESKQALDQMVQSIAERLDAGERKNFVSQLPAELQAIALVVGTSDRRERHQDIIQEFMEKERIEQSHAKKQVLTAWAALKSFISPGEIQHLKAQLPNNVAGTLY